MSLSRNRCAPSGNMHYADPRRCPHAPRQKEGKPMPEFPIRKIAVLTEEIFHEGGLTPNVPRRRAAAMALVKNPFAGRYVEELQGAMEDLKPLGLELTDRLIAALGGDGSVIEGYGKGAIVGTEGELEHGALWHVPGGYAMRERLGEAKAIVPSAKHIGAFGSRLDVQN